MLVENIKNWTRRTTAAQANKPWSYITSGKMNAVMSSLDRTRSRMSILLADIKQMCTHINYGYIITHNNVPIINTHIKFRALFPAFPFSYQMVLKLLQNLRL